MEKSKSCKKIVARLVCVCLWCLLAINAQAQVPTINPEGTSNNFKTFLNGIKNSKVVVEGTKMVGKAQAAIGEAKGTVSEYVTKNKEKLERATTKLKKYKERVEEYKKQYEDYKSKAMEYKDKAMEYKDKATDYYNKGMEYKDKAMEYKDKALEYKDKAMALKDDALSTASALKDTANAAVGSAQNMASQVSNKVSGAVGGTSQAHGGNASVPQTGSYSGNTSVSQTRGYGDSYQGGGSTSSTSSRAQSLGTTSSLSSGNVYNSGNVSQNNNVKATTRQAFSNSQTVAQQNTDAIMPVAAQNISAEVQQRAVSVPQNVTAAAQQAVAADIQTMSTSVQKEVMADAQTLSSADMQKVIATSQAQLKSNQQKVVDGKSLSSTAVVQRGEKASVNLRAQKLNQSLATDKAQIKKELQPNNIRRSTFKTLEKRSSLQPIEVEHFAFFKQSEPLAFAFEFPKLPDGGIPPNGKVLIPPTIATVNNLSSEDVKKAGTMDEYIVKMNDTLKGEQVGNNNGAYLRQGKRELVAAYVVEAYKAQKEIEDLADKVIDSIELAPAMTEQDQYGNMVEANKAVVQALNSFLQTKSALLLLDAYENYVDFKFSTPNENEEDK